MLKKRMEIFRRDELVEMLILQGQRMTAMEKEIRTMQNMLYGNDPVYQEIMRCILEMQTELDALRQPAGEMRVSAQEG